MLIAAQALLPTGCQKPESARQANKHQIRICRLIGRCWLEIAAKRVLHTVHADPSRPLGDKQTPKLHFMKAHAIANGTISEEERWLPRTMSCGLGMPMGLPNASVPIWSTTAAVAVAKYCGNSLACTLPNICLCRTHRQQQLTRPIH